MSIQARRKGVASQIGPPDRRPPPVEAIDPALAAWVQAGGLAFVLLDGEGRVLGANRAAATLLDFGARDLTGTRLGDAVHADDRGWSEPQLALLLAGRTDRVRCHLRLVSQTGAEHWAELTVHATGQTADGAARAVAVLEPVGDPQLREQELQRLAETDPLTGLFNRRRFDAELARHLALSARYGARGALLVLDIDGLKRINDTYGHVVGDDVIMAAGALLRAHTRASDVPARIGGDEFAVLLPAGDVEEASAVASSLLRAARATTSAAPGRPLSVSVGIATLALSRPADATRLFEHADAAMYQVKRRGGDDYAVGPAPRTPPPAPAAPPGMVVRRSL